MVDKAAPRFNLYRKDVGVSEDGPRGQMDSTDRKPYDGCLPHEPQRHEVVDNQYRVECRRNVNETSL